MWTVSSQFHHCSRTLSIHILRCLGWGDQCHTPLCLELLAYRDAGPLVKTTKCNNNLSYYGKQSGLLNTLLATYYSWIFRFAEVICPAVNVSGFYNVTYATSNAYRHYGSVMRYQCIAGFVKLSGDESQVCAINETWTGTPLMCQGMYTQLQGVYTFHFNQSSTNWSGKWN